MGSSVNIDPQLDGVVMLSPEIVYFNDAQERPDGRKIYHIFEKNNEESTPLEDEVKEIYATKDFETKKSELFSKASEYNLQNIQQALARNGILMYSYSKFPSNYKSLVAVVPPKVLLTNSTLLKYGSSNPLISEDNGHVPNEDSLQQRINEPSTLANDDDEDTLVGYHHFTIFKVHQFCMNYPIELQNSVNRNRLIRRLLRKGITDVEFEPENFCITVKTKRPAHIALSLLKRIDPNVYLISTSRNVVIRERPNILETDFNHNSINDGSL